MGRKPIVCKHGITSSSTCPECRRLWNKKHNARRRQKIANGEISFTEIKGEFPVYDLAENARQFVKENYYLKNPITKFFLENHVKEPKQGDLKDYCGRQPRRYNVTNYEFEG